jgi:nicotinate-nucleotide adenylyltransferase
MRARSVGILGGTFNPPHLGHVALARTARRELQLERVLLVPARLPPHKPGGEEDPGAEHRLRMCRLAVEGLAGLSVSAVEIERDGPSYTVDTLNELNASHPDTELTLILGADIASTLPAWREPARLLELARVAVAPRVGTPPQSVLDALAAVPAGGRAAARVSFLEMEPVAISSSAVRARVAAGEPIEQLVTDAVAAYIAEHHLYRAPVEASV